MLKFLRVPFAQSGDRATVPDAVVPGGDVSYTEGYGADYAKPKTDPASKNIEREKMNQLFFDTTTAVGELQSRGVPDFITTALNGGSPFGYAKNAIVRHSDDNLYISLVPANTSSPTDAAKWARFDLVAARLGDGSDVGFGDALVAVHQPFAGAVTRSQHQKNAETISVAEFLTGAANGVVDNTADLQNAINAAVGKRLIGIRGDTYLVRDQLVIPSNIEIDWQGATIIDDVRTFRAPDQSNRAKPLFYMYGVRDVVIKNFIYQAATTRATVSNEIPTGIIWIGDNSTTGDGPTYNIEVCGITASNCADFTLFVAIVGNAYNLHIHDIDIVGNCPYGVNIEYGEAPSGPTGAAAYGMHPYNVRVERFNGYDNAASLGFLRIAAAYNVTFSDCYGKDVARFIYAWTGDRSISRVSQNVKFLNCSHYASDTFLPGVINYCAQVLSANKDGSTGDPLPVWTNYDHLFTFENCQFQNNKTTDSAAVRFYGSQGSTVFKSCIFRNSYYGARVGPGSNPDYTSVFSLTFTDCVFINNSRDILLASVRGVLIEHCKFRNPDNTLIPIKMETSSIQNRVKDCSFSDCTLTAYVVVDAGCLRNEFSGNSFGAGVSAASLDLRAETLGSNNSSSPALTLPSWDYFGVLGEPASLAADITLVPASECDAAKRRQYVAQTGGVVKTIDSIINGQIGDEVVFQSTSAGASVTFTHLAAVGMLNRLICPTGADLTKTGNLWTVRAKLTEGGWLLAD